MSEQPGDQLGQQFQEAFEEQGRNIGHFNLAVFGKVGVGKTTLVNAIFGEERGETGIGKPVTRERILYKHESGHFGMVDTPGLEIGQDSARILRDLKKSARPPRPGRLLEQRLFPFRTPSSWYRYSRA
jgi:predicted GTPase